MKNQAKAISIKATEIRKLISENKFKNYINVKGGNKFPQSLNDAYDYILEEHEDGTAYIKVIAMGNGRFVVALKNLEA